MRYGNLFASVVISGAGIVSASPASAVITTFANYSGIGGANLYWQRTGTNYVVAKPVVVVPVVVKPVVVVPKVLPVVGTPAQKAAAIAANNAAANAAVIQNAKNVVTANAQTAANKQAAIIQNAKNVVTANNLTAASAAAAAATAGGNVYTIASPTSKVAGSVGTKFSFLTPSAKDKLRYLSALGALDANFTLIGTAAPGTPITLGGGFDIQSLTSGTFSFIYTGAKALHVGHSTYATGANLLSATFVGGAIAGPDGSTSGSVGDSTGSGGTIVYTSDFLNFLHASAKDFSISASSITPPLGFTAHQALNTFKGTTTGSFSSDPAPGILAVVPEPEVWGLMVVGFGMIGVLARRRSSRVAA